MKCRLQTLCFSMIGLLLVACGGTAHESTAPRTLPVPTSSPIAIATPTIASPTIVPPTLTPTTPPPPTPTPPPPPTARDSSTTTESPSGALGGIGQQQAHVFESQITNEAGVERAVRLNYLLYLPPGYAADSTQRWPLILYLHGLGDRGDNIEMVRPYGLAKVVEQKIRQGEAFPFIVVSPQNPPTTFWGQHVDALHALLEEISATYAVDRTRQYVTGISDGGFATWGLAITYPDQFAALAPVASGSYSADINRQVCALKDAPVWAFHGEKDSLIPVEPAQRLIDTLKACGGNARLTVFSGLDHVVWDETYTNPELYTWLLAHRR